nr:creatininase family protein [Aestuariivita sp.]
MGVQLGDFSWHQISERLQTDCRLVLPLGATEQHGDLSLETDSRTAEAACQAACKRSGLIMAPVLPFGASAFSVNFPGTVSLRTATISAVIEDMIDGFYRQGFRRLIFVTGHGGNEVITGTISEAMLDRPQLAIHYVSVYGCMADEVAAVEQGLGAIHPGDHASWYEALPFNRVGPIHQQDERIDFDADFPEFPLNPRLARARLGKGVLSGRTTAPDAAIERVWRTAIDNLCACFAKMPPEPPEA